MSDDLGNFSMLELFRLEVDNQASILNDGLLSLEQQTDPAKQLEALMRASHSIKGAARMVDIDAGVKLAHAMEDCFVAAQSGELLLQPHQIDLLLEGVDLLVAISKEEADVDQLTRITERIAHIDALETAPAEQSANNNETAIQEDKPAPVETSATETTAPSADTAKKSEPTASPPAAGNDTVRVSAESLNKLVGLAGEVQVESRWLHPFSDSLQQIKHRQAELIHLLDNLNDSLLASNGDEYSKTLASEIHTKANRCRHLLSDRLIELDEFDRRLHGLSNRLHGEVISSRMRPFSDATRAYPRLVRDVARQLGKQVELKVEGLATQAEKNSGCHFVLVNNRRG